MKYHFKIHKESKGYWAECVELKGCLTQGDSMAELHRNMTEALNLYLAEPADSKMLFPLPKKISKKRNVVAIAVEPKIAFSFYMRQLRLAKKMTQSELAKKLGFKNIYSYQRLENSKTANPELTTLVKLKEVFPEMDLDEVVGF